MKFLLFILFLLFFSNGLEDCQIPESLWNDSPSKNEIIENAHKICRNEKNEKNQNIIVQAYINPNNPQGKIYALDYPNKFDIISPMWYYADYTSDEFIIHEYDIHNDLKILELRKNSSIKIIPMIQFYSNLSEWIFVLHDPRVVKTITQVLLEFIVKNQFDGLVFHIGLHIINTEFANTFLKLFKDLTEKISKTNLSIIVTFPLVTQMIEIDKYLSILKEYLGTVNYVQLMAYDYEIKRFNSPMFWIKNSLDVMKYNNLKMNKLLLGIPLFGYIFEFEEDSELISADTFIDELLNGNPQILWDVSAKEAQWRLEHKLEQHLMTYPTLKFIKERIDIAKIYGCGISLFELGFSIPLLLNAI